MKRVALYVRVSTQEQKQNGLSVDSQINALREWIKENDYVEAGLYNDAGFSARKRYKTRPALMQLLEDCKSNKIDLIAFTKLDRWTRNLPNYYEIQSILDACKVPWRTIWEDYETETSAGIFKVNIMLSVAQAESDRTSERIKAVNDYRRSQGLYVGGKSPTGYKINKGHLIKDESTKSKVDSIFDYYLNTFNIDATLRFAHSLDINITRDTLVCILKSETYCGTAGDYECDPYISKEQHSVIIKSFETKKRVHTSSGRVYIFQGLCKCSECGRAMVGGASRRNYNGVLYLYKIYRCRRHHDNLCSNNRTINESVIERELISRLDDEFHDFVISAKTKSESDNIDSSIEKLQRRLKRIGDRYEDDDIDINEYKTKRNAILSEIASLKSRVVAVPSDLPHNWHDIYSQLDETKKRAFWMQVLKRVEIPADKNQKIKLIF